MYKQLSGMDSLFLYAEKHRTPLEVGCLAIYDPATSPGDKVRFKEILAAFQASLDLSDVFRQRLVEVPFSLDHPYWIIEDDIDLEYHVRHISLPKPGDWDQLMAQVSRLHARRLNRSKPLWMVHVIEGLGDIDGVPPGSFAMFMKFHHAAIDGMTGQEVLAMIHDADPNQPDASEYQPATGIEYEPRPGAWNLIARTPLNTAVSSVKLGFGFLRSLPAIVRLGLAAADTSRPEVPMTLFNAANVSPNRAIDGRFFDLDECRSIGRSIEGATINDVALTVVGGAMRRYLESKDALPDETLVAACPINLGSEVDASEGRPNLLSAMSAELHTDIADPKQRLQAVRDSTRSAKNWVERFGAAHITDIPKNLPAPIARGIYPMVNALVVYSERLLVNTFVSNVEARHTTHYFAGAKLIGALGVGPVLDRCGVFHAVFSLDDKLSIGFTACRDMLPDPEFYAGCIELSFEELRAATLGQRKSKNAMKKKARRRKPAVTSAAVA
jgi:WS/DGAT/MGAT family acyltransferase